MQDPVSNVGAAPRAYRSQARSDGARLTRQRITRAASELFAVHGFAGTTVSGAALDPAVLELRARADRYCREGLRGLIATLVQADALCAGLTEVRALDRAWMLTDVMLYLDATNGCGWSDDEYEDWLADLLQQQLLSP